MYAAHGDHPHCVNELLLRGADFTATNESGDTAYTIVVRNNSHLGKEEYFLRSLSGSKQVEMIINELCMSYSASSHRKSPSNFDLLVTTTLKKKFTNRSMT